MEPASLCSSVDAEMQRPEHLVQADLDSSPDSRLDLRQKDEPRELGCLYETVKRNFPHGPVVKNPHFHCREHGSVPGWGTKISHALGCLHACTGIAAKKRERENRLNDVKVLRTLLSTLQALSLSLPSPWLAQPPRTGTL